MPRHKTGFTAGCESKSDTVHALSMLRHGLRAHTSGGANSSLHVLKCAISPAISDISSLQLSTGIKKTEISAALSVSYAVLVLAAV